jgi:branched-subunit amino acid ABC-type transport system permease component
MDLALLILIRASTYALVAVGFALVFGSCRVLNLTHGFYVMLGAYATHFFSAGLAGLGVSVLREPLAVLGAAIATGLFGWLFFKLMQVTRRTAPAELLPLSVAANLLGAQTFQILFGTAGLNVAPILQGRIVLGTDARGQRSAPAAVRVARRGRPAFVVAAHAIRHGPARRRR